jgi:hypothetical protein
MFTRVYQAINGTVELYTTATNHKEAIDWARLSTSEIAKELNDKSMEEIFTNSKDAYDKLAVQPDWKPHTLAQRIENLITPEKPIFHSRRKQVVMSYELENDIEERTQRNPTTNATNNTTTVSKTWKTTTAEAPLPTPPQDEKTNETKSTGTQKVGTNKYKVAAAEQDNRMRNIEKNIATMINIQQHAQGVIQEELQTIKNHQDATKEALEAVVEAVAMNQRHIQANKKETDNTLKMFRASLVLLDQAMDKTHSSESPPRKISRPTIPPEDHNMSNDNNSDSDSFGSISTNAPKSDDKMKVVAGGN